MPNGERLNIPPNVRIMFEVQDLRYATLATVSRCGMIWFSEHVLTLDMLYENYFGKLHNLPLTEGNEDEEGAMGLANIRPQRSLSTTAASSQPSTPAFDAKMPEFPATMKANPEVISALNDQRLLAAYLRPYFWNETGGADESLVTKCLEYATRFDHIMDFTRLRALGSMFTMLNQAVRQVLVYNQSHDFRLGDDVAEKYMVKSLILAILWSFSGDCKLKYRVELGEFIRTSVNITMPPPSSAGAQQSSIIDFEVNITTGEWVSWLSKVPQIEVETHKVATPDVVVPTVDTIRHESLLFTWLSEHKPLLLCGPPGKI